MKLQIHGIRGIPAQHGGFETFAEHFSIYLQQKGWQVTVYCQEETEGVIREDYWQGIHRVHIPVNTPGAKGTMIFDWKSIVHAAKRKEPVLTLGYNTAIFNIVFKLIGIPNVINMDGIEWRRGKWCLLERIWLYANEKIGSWIGNHLIADHPEIKKHLSGFISGDKVSVIPYSADIIESANKKLLDSFGLQADRFVLVIARPEMENSILEIVNTFSRKKRGMLLVILGNYNPQTNVYHKKVMDAASDEVKFVGAIYEKKVVQALRFYARLYVHGHTVGGTNPSLVEALGAGSAVLAHDNRFNRWVAGNGAHYFLTQNDCAKEIEMLLVDDQEIATMRECSLEQIRDKFTWDKIHTAYEKLLLKFQCKRQINPIFTKLVQRGMMSAMSKEATSCMNCQEPSNLNKSEASGNNTSSAGNTPV